MSVAIITGSSGLIGSEAAKYFHHKGYEIVGIDNNLRKYFFGEDGSTEWKKNELQRSLKNFVNFDVDIRDFEGLKKIFNHYKKDIKVIIHAAAQPSHDWAAKEPFVDFSVNATGTLNLLEAFRLHAPDATFIFTSTNKVYGDTPNFLPLEEKEFRFEISPQHTFFKNGIDESMSIDHCKHSLFGVSKASADLMVQEYGQYFHLKTAIFRGGCLTGPNHSGAELHGFLAYLVRCAVEKRTYSIFGHNGKQVRDNIHSHDLIRAFDCFISNPQNAAVYNIGGSRFSNCSILEAINFIEKKLNQKMKIEVKEGARIGDHIWWISDISKFQKDYPQFQLEYSINSILEEIIEATLERNKSKNFKETFV